MSPWKDIPFDEAKMADYIYGLTVCPKSVIICHEKGFIAGTMTEPMFSPQKLAMELAWFADEQGKILLQAFEQWGETLGAEGIIMASLFYADQDNDRYLQLFEKAGYKPRESFYYKEIK